MRCLFWDSARSRQINAIFFRYFRALLCSSNVLSFSTLIFHRIHVETSAKFETILSNVLRIHRNYAERASSELAADGSCYATLVEMANSDIMCQLLCNESVVTN